MDLYTIEKSSVSGNPVILEDSAKSPLYGLTVYGRSEQVTTTGAQLLDLSDLIGKTEAKNGATYKINEDQSVTVSGTPTEYTSFALKRMSLKAGSYYFTSNSNSNNVFIQLLGTKVNMNNGFTLDEDSDMIDAYMVFNVLSNNKQEFNLTFTSMLNAGDTALPWEPYTGGKPSPSPDYPQEIVSAERVIMQGKNLWHGGDFEVLVGYSLTGFAFAPQDLVDKVKALPDDTYSFSYKPIGSGNAGTNIGKISLIQNDDSQIDLGETITLTSEVRNKIGKIGIYGYLNQTNKITKFQIERSQEPSDYEPYHVPQTLTLNTPNGLPGIPVSSGGNYTDSSGRQWICDEVDFRGGGVQTTNRQNHLTI